MDQEAFDRLAPNFPGAPVLQAAVEKTSVCRKCKGPVRATLIRAEPSGSVASHLEILVHIYCRDARCGDQRDEWRPWSKGKPKVL